MSVSHEERMRASKLRKQERENVRTGKDARDGISEADSNFLDWYKDNVKRGRPVAEKEAPPLQPEQTSQTGTQGAEKEAPPIAVVLPKDETGQGGQSGEKAGDTGPQQGPMSGEQLRVVFALLAHAYCDTLRQLPELAFMVMEKEISVFGSNGEITGKKTVTLDFFDSVIEPCTIATLEKYSGGTIIEPEYVAIAPTAYVLGKRWWEARKKNNP